ncbi:hypothetical protein ACVGWT_01435, partial [Enterobacter hormaechei]
APPPPPPPPRQFFTVGATAQIYKITSSSAESFLYKRQGIGVFFAQAAKNCLLIGVGESGIFDRG